MVLQLTDAAVVYAQKLGWPPEEAVKVAAAAHGQVSRRFPDLLRPHLLPEVTIELASEALDSGKMLQTLKNRLSETVKGRLADWLRAAVLELYISSPAGYGFLLGRAGRWLRRHEDNLDLAHDVIGKVLAVLRRQCPPPDEPLAWLGVITDRVCISYGRTAGRRRQRLGRREDEAGTTDKQGDVRKQDNQLDGRDLLAALRKEDPPAAHMLAMSYAGDTYGEIAVRFKTTPQAVEKRVNRALDRIRGTLMLQMRSAGASIREITNRFQMTEEKALECIERAEKRRR